MELGASRVSLVSGKMVEPSPAQERSRFGKKTAQRQCSLPSLRRWGDGKGNCSSVNCSHLSAPGAEQLSAAAWLAVDYRFMIQPTMLKQKSSKFIAGSCFVLSRNEKFLCQNVMLFIQLPHSPASAVYLSSPFLGWGRPRNVYEGLPLQPVICAG